MEKELKFPMGTQEVARIKGCTVRAVQLTCKKLNIPRAGKPFVILNNTVLNKVLQAIHNSAGRPKNN
jgi:hypothetical protein